MITYATHIDTEKFEQLYIRLRHREGRLYSDEEVAKLPVSANQLHSGEWKIRKESCKKLLSYIQNKKTFLKILEVGCGNGWLSARLAAVANAAVTGIDINETELEQAKRVFSSIPNLKFIKGNLQVGLLKDEKFDMIVFAASIQYFPSLKQVINIAIEHLTMQGEIHIMDSHFYPQQELAAARQRTIDYYRKMGVAEMAGHYYHHTLNELENFQYKILYNPFTWKNKFSIKRNPFFRIAIKNRYS